MSYDQIANCAFLKRKYGKKSNWKKRWVAAMQRNAGRQRVRENPLEAKMKAILDTLAVQYRHQFVIGAYIVDFYVPSHRLVIEADGSGHREPVQAWKDGLRDEKLTHKGYQVVRFTSNQIFGAPDSVRSKLAGLLS